MIGEVTERWRAEEQTRWRRPRWRGGWRAEGNVQRPRQGNDGPEKKEFPYLHSRGSWDADFTDMGEHSVASRGRWEMEK